ncbi:MAG: hypothetical protein QOI59_3332, partial [Gammaproteobacteria bacterium]|nr:hypothetical protein [Gammaproteobacteria bacterium]
MKVVTQRSYPIRLSRRSFIAAGVAAATTATAKWQVEPDAVLHNGAIWTVSDRVPEVEALAISGGRIMALGRSAEMLALAGAQTRKIDLGKKRVTPGFYDAHSHPVLSGVEHLRKVACDKSSIEAIQKDIRERAAKTPAGKPVLGFLYDDGKTPQPLSRWDLDKAAPEHPVMIIHRGGHTMFVNSLALKMAGVTDGTPQPEHGQYFRDANGKLNGRIADHGMEPFEKLAAYEPSREDYRQGTALISKMFVSKGVTSACDADGNPATFQGAQDARDAGLLKIRLYNHTDEA